MANPFSFAARYAVQAFVLVLIGLLLTIAWMACLCLPARAHENGLLPPAASYSPEAAGGTAILIPDHAQVIEWTTIQLVYTVGDSAIAETGGIQVQFPKSWHPRNPDPWAPQTIDPQAQYYVTAQTSVPGAIPVIGITNQSLDGRTDYGDWTATITLAGGSLAAGDVITYTFGDRNAGGKGVRANVTAMVEAVRVAVDAEGDGTFQEISDAPSLTVNPLSPSRLAVYVPSITQPGTPFRLSVTAQDSFTNLASDYTGTVHISATDPQALLPADYTFTPADLGHRTFTVTLMATGTHWITVTDSLLAPAGQRSNPTDSWETTRPNIYWGDLHSHTEFSNDGIGPLSRALARVREELALDFYAATDHIDTAASGLTLPEWEATRTLIQQNNSPGHFVSILGYEWSLPAPYGHHNVYFEGEDGPLCYHDQAPTLPDLWDCLGGQAALTIPHHTGVRWRSGPVTVDWSFNRPEFRTSIEIFSGHGESERYDPPHPLSYENRRPGLAWSVDGPHYARDAWIAGHLVGVVGGSDNHNVLTGEPWNGLTAICTDSLTRSELFNAIRNRHTYATTGERIVLDFRLGDAMMGDVVPLSQSEEPTLSVHVAGTTALDWVQLVRSDGVGYTVLYTATPEIGGDPYLLDFSFTDTAPPLVGLYYVRVQQPDPNKPDRPAMAWSSPIWVSRKAFLYFPLVEQQW